VDLAVNPYLGQFLTDWLISWSSIAITAILLGWSKQTTNLWHSYNQPPNNYLCYVSAHLALIKATEHAQRPPTTNAHVMTACCQLNHPLIMALNSYEIIQVSHPYCMCGLSPPPMWSWTELVTADRNLYRSWAILVHFLLECSTSTYIFL